MLAREDVERDLFADPQHDYAQAVQWGRRWITCDTSRVALALAKHRLMTAKFDYQQLRPLSAEDVARNPHGTWLSGKDEGKMTFVGEGVTLTAEEKAEDALLTLAGEWRQKLEQVTSSAPGQDRTPPVMIVVCDTRAGAPYSHRCSASCRAMLETLTFPPPLTSPVAASQKSIAIPQRFSWLPVINNNTG